MTSIYMLLCFTVQNLTEIGQSAAELRLNNYFAIWHPPFWFRSCCWHRVLNLLLCIKLHQNGMIFHWAMAI